MNKKKSQKHCLSKKKYRCRRPTVVSRFTPIPSKAGKRGQCSNPHIKPHRARPLHFLQYPNVKPKH